MFKRFWFVGALALALILPHLPVDAQGDRRSAAEAYAWVVDYPLLIEQAATRRAAELPAAEREAFVKFITKEVDFDMTRFYAISAMVDLFEASELNALASFAATPDGRSAWPSCSPSARSSTRSSSARLRMPSAGSDSAEDSHALYCATVVWSLICSTSPAAGISRFVSSSAHRPAALR